MRNMYLQKHRQRLFQYPWPRHQNQTKERLARQSAYLRMRWNLRHNQREKALQGQRWLPEQLQTRICYRCLSLLFFVCESNGASSIKIYRSQKLDIKKWKKYVSSYLFDLIPMFFSKDLEQTEKKLWSRQDSTFLTEIRSQKK